MSQALRKLTGAISQEQVHRHLHQPDPREDRRDVRQPRDDARRPGAEVLRTAKKGLFKNGEEPPDEKRDPIADFMTAFAERMKNTRTGDQIEYPIEVSKIKLYALPNLSDKVGSWVSVRPVGEEYGGKTFLGIYLGDLPSYASESYNIVTKEVEVLLSKNPAIYVPDLKKVIRGYESWWGVIDSPEKLQKITDKDIENVWYVKALKELAIPE
jgi:hypothetical protein